MRFDPIFRVFWAWLMFLVLFVKGFQLSSIRPSISIQNHAYRRCNTGVLPTPNSKTTTCLHMIERSYNDPDALLQMVQELTTTQEFPQETMERMEELQMALTTFVEETSNALLEQEQSMPKPPSVPPPNAMLDDPWQQQTMERDLASDLAQAGTALELLQQRLRYEEEALMQAEAAFQEVYDEDATYQGEMQGYSEEENYSYQEQGDILYAADEALRQSREAAEKRRIEAEKRSVNNARLSAGYRKQQLEEQVQDQQEIVEQLREEQAEKEAMENFYGGETMDQDYDTPRTTKRPTMELGSLFGNKDFFPKRKSQAPGGVPIVYDWVQNPNGSITGTIKGSKNFRDGAKISTSPIMEEAQGGMTVTTQSGSRYYLEQDLEDEIDSTPTAPDGVPTVKSWELRGDGGIIGLVYNSPYADDGDYIETSPIVDGEIDNYSVVATESGSQYFLSGDPPKDSTDNLSAFSNESSSKRSTITLPKLFNKARGGKRSTFSLFDLFDEKPSEPPQPLPPPTPDKIPPQGTPILTGCTFNDNGTITGYIFGSPKLENGLLVTTSKIVEGKKEQFETVATASGSLYYLG